ncbi:AraC family transcriptional regulator [Carnobacterium alterfunditum]|uniref:AraC family transcriptional regulator n=1 Tax=Carnobacterium alterfunditum TaxID=28230 RepID=UPI003593BA8A
MGSFFLVDQSYKNFLDSIGVNGERVFKKAGIPYENIDDEGISINKEQYVSFMNSMETVTTNEHILKLSNVEELVLFVPPLFAAMCARNGMKCIERLATYKQLMGPFALTVVKHSHTLELAFVFDDYHTPIPRFTVLSEQVLIVAILRKATGMNIVPKKVSSLYEYGDEFEQYFGVKPHISEKNALSFDLADMQEPFLTANNTMWQYLEPELKKRIDELESDDSYAAKVRNKLIELIPGGAYTVDDVATDLGVSPRTLQRRLNVEKTTFIKQLNHTRELVARNYLKNESMSTDEVAFLVGYSDGNVFNRAFRSWTGQTVSQFKKKYNK